MEVKDLNNDIRFKWDGKWIHGNQLEHNNNTYYYFRKTINLDKVEDQTQIFISAESKYKLYINEEYVSYGSLQSQPFYKYYDVVDISQYLQEGDNIIAIHVYFLGTIDNIEPGVLCQINDQRGNTILASDETWKVKLDQSRRQDTYYFSPQNVVPYQEHYNALEDINWKSLQCDDSMWDYATEYRALRNDRSTYAHLSGPWSRLIPRDIAFMALKDMVPLDITRVEEHIGLYSRTRSQDISINLSAKGKPIEYATADEVMNVLEEEGISTFKTSTDHLDKVFDGYYNPSIVLDFGKVITGSIKLDISASSGQIIDIGYAERLVDGEFNNAIEGSMGDRYITKDGRQMFEAFSWKGFRYIKILFRKCFEGVEVNSVKASVTMYPFEDKGLFESSDQMLNKVFDICKYTIRICSNECITDTPFREQGQWLGDVSAVTLGAIYSCFGDVRLAEKFIRQSAANQMPTGLITNMTNCTSFDWQNTIADYSLWWVMAIWKHYMYTGKEWVIHDNYPTIIKIMEAFVPYINDYGMIEDMPYWVFIDWAYLDRRGECCPLNAIYYGAIEALLKIAEFRNDHYIIERYKTIAENIKGNFMKRFYNKDLGVFCDANVLGDLSSSISEQANASALYFGLCDDKSTKSIVNHLYVDKDIDFIESQPYYATFSLQALKKMGRIDIALDYIKDRWGKRMVGKGAKSCYEEWYENGSWRFGQFTGFMRTHSHAWSAHPAEFLIKDLAGIDILEPGCNKLSVKPMKTEFDYKIVYPILSGQLIIQCENGKVKIINESSSEIIEL